MPASSGICHWTPAAPSEAIGVLGVNCPDGMTGLALHAVASAALFHFNVSVSPQLAGAAVHVIVAVSFMRYTPVSKAAAEISPVRLNAPDAPAVPVVKSGSSNL